MITDISGNPFRNFSVTGKISEKVAWDGRDDNGNFLQVGNVYSYILTLSDRAGNKRNIIGKPFSIDAVLHQERDAGHGLLAHALLGGDVDRDDAAVRGGAHAPPSAAPPSGAAVAAPPACSSRRHVPLRPPLFSSNRTPLTSMPRSIALHMS